MKKTSLIALFLFVSFTLFCGGCGSTPLQSPSAPAASAEPEPLPVETPSPAQEPENALQLEDLENVPFAEEQGKVLVVYFSATGNTRGVAEKIAALTGGDLVEILPAQPYTAEDLNYNDSSTRATKEQNTPDARPGIANEISLDGYATVYLGYPIWWGQAPRIMSSFVESHDFSGITVVPFCTSGSSGAGSTGETLGEQAGTGTFLSATRFPSDISESDLQDWIDSRS